MDEPGWWRVAGVASPLSFRSFVITLILVIATAIPGRPQEYEGKTLVKATLLAKATAIVPGQPLEVGVLLEMAPGWHTYWEYSGDAGLPTSIAWTLPEGFAAGPIQWPLPQRILEPGDIEVYAYKDKVLLLTTLVPPASLQTGSPATLRAEVSWLVCAEICIPGSANLELTLPVAPSARAANEELFQQFQSQVPSPDAPPFPLSWKTAPPDVKLTVRDLPPGTRSVSLFPLPTENQTVGHPKDGSVEDGTATVQIETTPPLRGILVVDSGGQRQGWYVASAESALSAETPSASSPAPAAGATTPRLWQALLFGFIGGLILNLMPCVLPVISLKIFGFIRQAGDRPEKILRHGLAFSGGIFAWFLGLGILVAALKSAGQEVTWAFQFQNPWFNVVLCVLVFGFALNLFGVFEIVLPGRAATALTEASSGHGYSGSFFQGVFATVLATPCTAPFLGTALGFAFSQSAFIILTMFAAVALGMAAPYLLLSAQPNWMKILPRPGAWMERVRQLMGFPLIATLLWLLFILGNQKGLDAVIALGAFLLCVAFACWLYGAFCGPLSTPRTRALALSLAFLSLLAGGWYFLGRQFVQSTRAETSSATDGIPWVPFSQKALDDYLNEGRPVFVDFTADWCISCKFNERTALDVPAVRAAIHDKGIVPMKADWTNANPEITAALKKFGRVGVPFYVLYPAGRADQPVILPEILTESIVVEALAKAVPGTPESR